MRVWLRKNKIYFDTVAALLLSIMAVVVGGAQVWTSWLQARVAEAQVMPQFDIRLMQVLNPETGKYDDDTVIVENHGASAEEFHADAAYFITVDASRSGMQLVKTRIPINGYFSAQFESGTETGQLTKFSGYRNNAQAWALIRATSDLAASRHWDYANTSEFMEVRLQYLDVLGKSHEDYYEVHGVGPASRMSESAGRAEFAAWSDTTHRVELSSLTADRLLSMASGHK
jgi:hypothetical protein